MTEQIQQNNSRTDIQNYTPLSQKAGARLQLTGIVIIILIIMLFGISGWFFYSGNVAFQAGKDQLEQELDIKVEQLGTELREEQTNWLNQKFKDMTEVLTALIEDKEDSIADPFVNNQQVQNNLSYLSITSDNLIRNSSFESGENRIPRQWDFIQESNSSNTFQSQNTFRSGKFSLQFDGNADRRQLGISQPITKTIPGRTYTLSLYLKTVDVAPGATLRVGFWNEFSNTYASMEEIVLYPNLDWYRVSTTQNTSGIITDWANWYPIIEVRDHASGSVYIDDVQLTEGDVLIDYSSILAGGANNTISTLLGNGSVYVTSSGTMFPAEDGIGSLGTNANRWNELYLTNATITSGGDMDLQGSLSIDDNLIVKGSSTFVNNVTFQGTASFAGTSSFPNGITVGANDAFTINDDGDITKVNGVAYSFPNYQGASNEILINDGSGNLSWGTFGAASVAPDSLDFEQLKDALTLDDSTSIDVYDGTLDNDFRIYSSNTGNEILFVDGATASIGIGTTNPVYALDVDGGIQIGGTAVFNTINTVSDNNTVLTVSAGVLSGINTGGWDKSTSDDLTNATVFGGDVSGTYNLIQLGTDVVGSSELASSGVTAGTYGSTGGTAAYIPQFTVDQDGRITAASTVPFSLNLNFENPLTFENGVTRTVDTVRLGGPLTQDTRIHIGSTEVIFLDYPTGNVSLGNTNPSEKLQVVGNILASGSIIGTSFGGSGASITSLNASQLTTGTVPDGRITGSYTGLTNLTGSGTATFGAFSGSGSSLTALNASQLTSGTVPDARLTGSYTGLTNLTGSGTATFGAFSGSGASLTSLNASQLTSGTLPDARFTGAYTGLTNLTGSGTATFGAFSGSGASLTALNASQLTTGTLPDARLTGSYTGLTNLNGSGTATFGTFSGSGASLTSLNASQLTSGTVADARITGAYTGITNLSMTGTLTLSQNAADTLNFSATSTNDARGLSFNGRTALSADSSDGYLRLNQGTEFTNGVYTGGAFRADGGLSAASFTTTAGEVRANVFRDGNSSYYLQPADTGTAGIFAGDVTIGGTENPFSRASINSNGARGLNVTVSGGSFTGMTVYTDGDQGLFYSANGAVYCSINAINALMECASDERLKKDIATLGYGLKEVNALRGVRYRWKDESLGNESRVGFIAQEVEKIIPELVSTNTEGIKSVGYSNFAPILVNAINDQQDIITNNYNTLALADAKLTSRVDSLSSNLSKMTGKQTDILGLQNNVTSLDLEIQSYATDILTLQTQMDQVFDIINKEEVASEEANMAVLTERVSFLEKLLGAETALASTDQDEEDLSIDTTIMEDLTITGKANIFDLGVVGDINAGQIVVRGKDAQINSLAKALEIQSDSTNPVEIMGGKVTIETNGNLTVKESVTAKKYNVDAEEEESASIGEATLKAGETEIVIDTTSVTESSKIFLTPTKETDLQLAVVEKERGKSFKVKIVKEAEQDISFNWWIVN